MSWKIGRQTDVLRQISRASGETKGLLEKYLKLFHLEHREHRMIFHRTQQNETMI